MLSGKKMQYGKAAVILFLLCCRTVSGAGFEPQKCLDLSAVIYPGNNGFAVMCVTANTYTDSALGFDYAGLSTSGKLSKDRWKTRLFLKMGLRKSAQLKFLMTLPENAAKRTDRFLIQADDPLFGQPQEFYPLPVRYADSGKLVFRSYLEPRKPFRTLTIDMKDNTAILAPYSKMLNVLWHPDKIVLEGLPEGSVTLDFVMPFKVGFRGAENGKTAIRRKLGRLYWWQIFPAEEIFYLTRTE